MSHSYASTVEKRFPRLPEPVGIIVHIVLFPCMWTRKYRETGKRPAEGRCIPPRMKLGTDNSRYVSNARNAEKIIGTKEPMMIRLKN